MKFRPDLLAQLTDEDIMEEVLANNHRYAREPLFSQTGTGSLTSATPQEIDQEIERNVKLIERLKERARKAGASIED